MKIYSLKRVRILPRRLNELSETVTSEPCTGGAETTDAVNCGSPLGLPGRHAHARLWSVR